MASATIAQIASSGLRMAQRQDGAGAQLLLLSLLAREQIDLREIAVIKPALRHRQPISPQAVRAGACRLRDCDARGGADRRARFRAVGLGEFRPGAAPARLFSARTVCACSAFFGRTASGRAPRSSAATICRCAARSGWSRKPNLPNLPENSLRTLENAARDGHKDAHGEVAEWLKAHAWKACIRETVSRVRIPLSPPVLSRPTLSAPF